MVYPKTPCKDLPKRTSTPCWATVLDDLTCLQHAMLDFWFPLITARPPESLGRECAGGAEHPSLGQLQPNAPSAPRTRPTEVRDAVPRFCTERNRLLSFWWGSMVQISRESSVVGMTFQTVSRGTAFAVSCYVGLWA